MADNILIRMPEEAQYSKIRSFILDSPITSIWKGQSLALLDSYRIDIEREKKEFGKFKSEKNSTPGVLRNAVDILKYEVRFDKFHEVNLILSGRDHIC